MDFTGLLTDAFDRIKDTAHATLDGLDPAALTYRPDADANTIAWLIWHLARVQDDHIAGLAGAEQVWTAAGFDTRFDLPFPASAIGYGQSSDDVAAVRSGSDELLEYLDAVHAKSVSYVETLTAEDLDRVIDEDWDPPVTLAVRMISMVSDDLQHVGQAAYVRGLFERQ